MCDELGEQMMDERWTLVDKVFQLKGVVDLHDRNKAWAKTLTKEVRKKRHKDMQELARMEGKLRETVNKIQGGDREGINILLRQDPSIELQCKGKSFEEIETIVRQVLFLRRKELDRLIYEIQHKEDVFLDNQYKLEVLKIPPKIDVKRPMIVYKSQEIEALIENLKTKQEAALIVKDRYDETRKILQKDARCFDTVLTGLHMDTLVQCECVIKAMELGQMAMEDEAALKEKYHRLNKEYKQLEDEREERVNTLRKRVAKARNVYTKVQRQESFTRVNIRSKGADLYTKRLMAESVELDNIIDNIRSIVQIIEPIEIFPRIEKMMEKKYRLLRQVEINNTWLETENIRKWHMEAMQESLLHSVTEDTMKFAEDREWYKNEIENNERVIADTLKQISHEAKILVNTQIQLINLYRIVEPVKIGPFKMEVLEANLDIMERRVARIGNEGANASQSSALNFMEPAERRVRPEDNEDTFGDSDFYSKKLMDINQLLDVISAKIDIIKTQIGEVDQSEREVKRALLTYKTYMMNRAAAHLAELPKTPEEKEDDMGEIGRSKLPTREEMKLQSKRLVAARSERPKASKSKYIVKKHICY